MQNTRLNQIVDATANQVQRWLRNPWRRISLFIICLLLGFFAGTAVSTIAGQEARLELTVGAVLLVITELITRLAYSKRSITNSLWVGLLNAFRLGFIYSMYVEALKLGS